MFNPFDCDKEPMSETSSEEQDCTSENDSDNVKHDDNKGNEQKQSEPNDYDNHDYTIQSKPKSLTEPSSTPVEQANNEPKQIPTIDKFAVIDAKQVDIIIEKLAVINNNLSQLTIAVGGLRQSQSTVNDNIVSIQKTVDALMDGQGDLSKKSDSLKEIYTLQVKKLDGYVQSISDTTNNLQQATNYLNEVAGYMGEGLMTALESVQAQFIQNCNNEYKGILNNAATNYQDLQKAINKWQKKVGNQTEYGSTILICSAIITPVLLILLIFHIISII